VAHLVAKDVFVRPHGDVGGIELVPRDGRGL